MTIRNLKSQRGFTLVEVIVVAVIVAILAGVSVPLYLGYINNSRENSAANAAGSAASFAAACVNTGKSISLLSGTPITGEADGSKKIWCGTVDDAASPALIVPTDITLTRTDNTIKGKHKLGGAESQPYTFTTAAPAAPPAGS
jgi:prepilin-type N-terminal cleavage/methylation domain-containing protein